LPKCKDKKKWQEIVQEAKLFVQEMWTAVYRRPRIAVQRISFFPDTKDPIDTCSEHRHQGYFALNAFTIVVSTLITSSSSPLVINKIQQQKQ
jgi:hypothetical protein